MKQSPMYVSEILPLALLLLLAAACRGASAGMWGRSGPPTPRFAVVSAGSLREGKGRHGQLDQLQQGAAGEGFLDRLLGTNCFTQAVGVLTADCRRMDPDAKTRLALRLANCQLALQGGEAYPCHPRQPLKECTEQLSERAHALFVEFLTHADTMCLYLQNQDFERYTENMLNRLAEGAGFAREQLAAVAKSTAGLAGDTAALKDRAEAALGMLREHRELEEESLQQQKKARAEATAYYRSLDSKQQQSLELQDEALQRQAALQQGQAATLQQVEAAHSALGGLFELVQGRATQLAEAAAAQAEVQRALAGELGALAHSSAGIRSAVDVVIGYQRRSDSVLMRLLGRSYGLEDAAFYSAGVLAALAAGASPATAKAKMPVLGLLGASLLGERLLIDRLHLWLDVDDQDQIVLNLPLPRWLPVPASLLVAAPDGSAAASAAGQLLLPLNLKWLVRRAAVAVGAAMLLWALLSYRDCERESFRLLAQLEAESRRRHEEYLALLNRHRVDLAAVLGGIKAGGTAGSGGRAGGKARGDADAPRQGRLGGGHAAAAVTAAPPLQVVGAPVPPGAAGGPAGGPLAPVSDDDDYEEEEEAAEQPVDKAAGAVQQAQPASQAAMRTPAAAPERWPPAASRPGSAPPVRPAAAVLSVGKRRAASDDVEGPADGSGGAGSKRRAGASRRRRSASVEAEGAPAEAMAVDTSEPVNAASKRGRKGSAGQGTAAKRARRS